jgi:glycosyltransferase involved in cell wall biosynthesis
VKIIFDVLGAPRGSGGPYLHARELLRAWLKEHPEDDITVVGPPGWAEGLGGAVGYVPWPNQHVVARVVGQWAISPLVARLNRDSRLLASLPVLSPFAPRARSYCFAHDWRHMFNPEEFSLPRRLYRSLWKSSVLRARKVFCISAKTMRETQTIAPGARAVLAPNGYDHARHWTGDAANEARYADLDETRAIVMAFGHRNNKRPELAIRAFSAACARGLDVDSRLVVLGAKGAYATELKDLALELGVESRCDFPGFVPDEKLAAIYKTARVVLVVSTDEGYGLPAAEGLYFGASVIATADSGLREVFGHLVTVVEADPESIGQRLAEAFLERAAASTEGLVPWCSTATSVRSEMKSR